jgi:uncharacterized membrane protein (Fun14 family)
VQYAVTGTIPVVVFLLGVYVIRVFIVTNKHRDTANPASAVVKT